MHMIGHYNISRNTVILFLQVSKPVIYQIISVDFFNQPEPFITGKCDEVQALIVWYFSANRHVINLLFSFHNSPESALHLSKKVIERKSLLRILLWWRDSGQKRPASPSFLTGVSCHSLIKCATQVHPKFLLKLQGTPGFDAGFSLFVS